MRKILSYLKEYKKESILGPLFKLFEAGLELIIPLLVAKVIDDGIKTNSSNQDVIILYSLLIIATAFVGFSFSIVAQYFNAKAAVGLSTTLRKNIFTKIQSLSYAELDNVGTSTLITRMTSDVNQVQTGVNLSLRLLLRSPIIVFGALIMALTIDLKLSLIFVGVITILFIIVLGIMNICIPLYKNVQSNLDSVTLSTRENLVGVRVIRAFAKEDDEKEKYFEKNKKLAMSQKFVGLISSFMNPLTYVVVNFGIILLVHFGAFNVYDGTLLQGNVIALYNYLSIILIELVKLANLIITINKSIACGDRINQVLNMNSSLEHKINSSFSKHYLEFKNVSFSYQKGSNEKALTKINFSVDRGEKIGIIGGTGSGKTSLINLIPHFYDVTEGEVLFDGKNVNSYEEAELRERMGIVPQKAVLFKGTIRSNLLWGKDDATEEEINEALEISQSKEFVLKKENGIDSEVSEAGNNFSGGQKQRLSIARAVIRKPEILIFDDSMSALDFATDLKLRRALNKLTYKPTIFIVSQRASSIQDCDKIIVLEYGKIMGIGTHEQLLNNCKAYQEIFYSQVKKEGE